MMPERKKVKEMDIFYLCLIGKLAFFKNDIHTD